MTRIGLLVNPAAGRGRAATAGPIALAELRAAGHDVVDLTEPDVTSARRRAAAFLREQPADAARERRGPSTVLVGVGGDGVANLAVNAILAHAPHVAFGLVPAGTGNDTARSLGLPRGDPVAAVARLLGALTREPRRVDVGEITAVRPSDDPVAPGEEPGDGEPVARRYFVNVLSAGIDAAVNGRANRIGWPKGSSRYVVALAAELVGFHGFDVRVVADGRDLGPAGTLVAVANSRSIGGGMAIAPDADWSDGLFDVVTAPTMPRRTLLHLFPRVYGGTHVTHPVVQVVRAREVLLLPGGTDLTGRTDRRRGPAPAPLVHADGEPVGDVPLRLRLVAEALRVLA
ncbi:diacylglycerol/lipid kinase family protein [Serinibacter arcticus]|uniref:Diacylglycerol kinase-related protein n=1 Tax=Serinibacter arcticus TaxID=1655435 RepID=A0A4Z1E4L2_9MICO|nr:diacylglycerol kinase family protein [Serinibacter arcticus]TGO04677.1 Diacylglycerol kinase-related protein [Serinibacter arcticus]